PHCICRNSGRRSPAMRRCRSRRLPRRKSNRLAPASSCALRCVRLERKENAMPSNSTVCTPISTNSFLKLAHFLKEQGSDRDPLEVIETAIEYWMNNASWKREDLMPETLVGDDARGYTWKSVFLPTGTMVRIKYDGSFIYAKVE